MGFQSGGFSQRKRLHHADEMHSIALRGEPWARWLVCAQMFDMGHDDVAAHTPASDS